MPPFRRPTSQQSVAPFAAQPPRRYIRPLENGGTGGLVDIFDEVEEELRAERAKRLWQRYGTAAIALIVLGIAAAGGWQFWKQRQAGRAEEAVASLLAAGSQSDKAKAAEAFLQAASQAPAGVAVLARLRAAAIKADTGDAPGALALWDAIAADTALDRIYRDLGSYNWVLHQVDNGDPAMLAARLGPLMEPGAPWRASAQELSALLDLRAGRNEAAKATLTTLADDTTAPAGVRNRARDLLSGLGS